MQAAIFEDDLSQDNEEIAGEDERGFLSRNQNKVSLLYSYMFKNT